MRIDQLEDGTAVLLRFVGSRGNKTTEEKAIFIGREGTDLERNATFSSLDEKGNRYTWQAYRYNGHWAYGTSADRLQLLEVIR